MTALPSIQQVLACLDELAAVTDEPGSICRTFLSPALLRANRLVAGWMTEVGCTVEEDGWGNLIGHLPAPSPSARTLLLGSHLDTVRHAGKFDGALGVLVALAALKSLADQNIRLPFHVDVLGFSDEEGTRFHSAYLGSKALTGRITEKDLDLRDGQGKSLREVVLEYQKSKSLVLPEARYTPAQLLGYVEVHIEQGPGLEAVDQPLAVVHSIAAQNRLLYTVKGRAGHAGTTPMRLRHDALAGAAELILAVEEIARETPALMATVGQLQVEPDVSNVIPAEVRASVDIRHSDLPTLQAACSRLAAIAEAVARRRGLSMTSTLVQGTEGVLCSPNLIRKLGEAVRHEYPDVLHFVSGAGHDGVVLAHLTEIGMLFVRCRDGLSHHPDEYASESDIEAAIRALTHFLRDFS